MGRARMDYNRRRASKQYSRAAEERLKANYNHRRVVLPWEKCIRILEWKLSAALDTDEQTHERNTDSPFVLLVRILDARRLLRFWLAWSYP